MIKKNRPTPESRERFLAQVRQDQATREKGYREQALRLFPHVCGRCGREFSGARLRELTVHHKDHNHLNNPADGSNWEMLCLYCHDDEHQRAEQRDPTHRKPLGSDRPPLEYEAFEGLRNLLPVEEDKPEPG
jgi:5-methylcytosine-specific restriction endonuclease McrA